MRCQRCGRVNRDDAVFCDACSARLTRLEDNTPSYPPDAAAPRGGDVNDAQPQPAWVLSPPGDAVFVGRQHEMALLPAALDDVLSGRGRLLMLVGEPGIGKTRTAQGLASFAARRGAQVLWGRCYETPGAPPYWPWVQIIRVVRPRARC
jgi:predicted ATP-dependent serine protease